MNEYNNRSWNFSDSKEFSWIILLVDKSMKRILKQPSRQHEHYTWKKQQQQIKTGKMLQQKCVLMHIIYLYVVCATFNGWYFFIQNFMAD